MMLPRATIRLMADQICAIAMPLLVWFRQLRVNQTLIMFVSLGVTVGTPDPFAVCWGLLAKSFMPTISMFEIRALIHRCSPQRGRATP
jgi:hypothetical protein